MFKPLDFEEVTEEKNKSRMKYVKEGQVKRQITYDVMKNRLLMYDVINRHYKLKDILEDLGSRDLMGTNCLCPFHGEVEGISKPSAKYYPETDRLYCFREDKTFTAYHALKQLVGGDMGLYFKEAWMELSPEVRDELIQKYTANEQVESKVSEFAPYRLVVEKFRSGEVGYDRYSRAMRKIIYEIYDMERTSIEKSFQGGNL